jgi:GTP pyrophosphokinase
MSSNLVNDLLKKVKVYQNQKEIAYIHKAIEFSKKAHKEQFRKSGDPYYYHPIEVAKLLSEIKLDNSSIICGLLHDTVEDTSATIEEIKKYFSTEIASLVDGLTKINEFSLKINNLKFGENYRKLLLATTQDLRVILIKLADRLHNMRTLDYIKDDSKKLKIALETQEIYAPLAQRLGMREWQEQLEDLAFKKINPEARSSIIDRLEYLNSKDENIIEEVRCELKKLFNDEDVKCTIN